MNKSLITTILLLTFTSFANTLDYYTVEQFCRGYKDNQTQDDFLCYWGLNTSFRGYQYDRQEISTYTPEIMQMRSKKSAASKYQLKSEILRGNIELCQDKENGQQRTNCVQDRTFKAFSDYYVSVVAAKFGTLSVVFLDIDDANVAHVTNYDGYEYYAFLK